MRLLVLGGTEFVGRAIVEEGLRKGWDVTTFNRGRHPGVHGAARLIGDRTTPEGITALAQSSSEWDVVADTWSWAPAVVRDTAAALARRVDRYVYVSSSSVYEFPTAPGSDESATVVDSSPDDPTFDDYARAKAGAERAVTDVFGDRALIARPGLILGPHENIGRLPWWLLRAATGGRMLAPGTPDTGIQYIDARDLAAWALSAAEAKVSGAVNAISTPSAATLEELLTACIQATGSDASLEWVPAQKILAAGIEPWSQLPIWLPPGEVYDTLFNIDVSQAIATGCSIRPIEETVRDTWAWLESIGGAAPQRPDRPPVGLDPQLEAQLLAS
ncbi:nucleoside-diphosphate-sugar epimerase [Okibacterium sp. HSC-33S16]|uniref:NAD-dependent epimerase/dehydratase family protein n=1 Tax=Okibacterium sp. HSC-33S16 TaxID=2910965 RepID=UPI00209C7A1C|nr:NAD-dependent epimerase/dehydratase family protein [Okibacterium sp. HSC-33S16]MCP2032814.1 nucleoside-diphosphate-sugar epimerase [Okibacterium sp. HSC-33S16]